MDRSSEFCSVERVGGFPKIIHQTWKVKEIPPQFQDWSESWKACNPDYLHHVWTDKENRLFIKQEFPELLSLYDNYDHHIKRVDAVRYCYLYLYGGIYCDLDFECIRGFDDLLIGHQDATVILGQMGEDPDFHQAFPNAIMISKPKSSFWLFVIEEMKKRANTGRPEDDTGPVLLTDCVNAYKGDEHVKILKPSIFYGISWNEEEGQNLRNKVLKENTKITASEFKVKFPEAYAVTYWSHSWGGGGSSSFSKKIKAKIRGLFQRV